MALHGERMRTTAGTAIAREKAVSSSACQCMISWLAAKLISEIPRALCGRYGIFLYIQVLRRRAVSEQVLCTALCCADLVSSADSLIMPVAPSTRGHNSGRARKGQCQHRRKQRCCPARAPNRHVCRAEASNGTSTADPLLLRAARGDGTNRTHSCIDIAYEQL